MLGYGIRGSYLVGEGIRVYHNKRETDLVGLFSNFRPLWGGVGCWYSVSYVPSRSLGKHIYLFVIVTDGQLFANRTLPIPLQKDTDGLHLTCKTLLCLCLGISTVGIALNLPNMYKVRSTGLYSSLVSTNSTSPEVVVTTVSIDCLSMDCTSVILIALTVVTVDICV